jgi:hypothetical protein
MRETKHKTIGDRGNVYHVTQFGARHGGRVLVRLLKMIGGAAGEALKSEGDFDMNVVGNVVANLAETVSENDFDYLCDTFAVATEVEINGKSVPLSTEGVFDVHFAGAYIELGQWLLFAVEVNFGSFLGAGGILKRATDGARPASAAAANAASASPSISPII